MTTGTVPSITAGTRVYAVLGDPVEHSLSPQLQNAAFQAAGVDGVYVALRCSDRTLSPLLRTLAENGGGGNVTVPHKERAAALVERPSAAVRHTGACNTFWWEEGRLCGDNTDVEGFREALRLLRGTDTTEERILLLGAGGASRAVLAALLDGEGSEVVLLNRTVERARELSRELGSGRVQVAEEVGALRRESFDVVVNATSLGLSPRDPLPLDLDGIGSVDAVLDLVYGPRETALVRKARASGLPAMDGREMLLRQGAAAFERWWGRPAPLAAMRKALEDASGGPGVEEGGG